MDDSFNFNIASAYFHEGGMTLVCRRRDNSERWSLKYPPGVQKIFWLDSQSDVPSLRDVWKAWWRLDSMFRYHERCAHMIAERYLKSSPDTQRIVDEWLGVIADPRALDRRKPNFSKWPWSSAYSGGELSPLQRNGWPWTEEISEVSYARPTEETVPASDVLSRADFDPRHSGPYMRAIAEYVRACVKAHYNAIIPHSSTECESVSRL